MIVYMNSQQVRVRFAPSPTGHLHIGGLRTALFNWLYARHQGGAFLLRIEDTDPTRSTQEYTDSILSSLQWCGIDYDEELVIQSQRIAEYKARACELVERGLAYACYCSPQELEARLGVNAAHGEGYVKYDRHCRSLQKSQDKPYAIRFRLPDTCTDIMVHDRIHGEVAFDCSTFDDFIILRSDGMPMYNFAVVIDDAFMRITHVIRGEEHLVNTPKQILLYRAFNFDTPQFAHLPLILGPDGSKLSKRDAATAVLDYKQNGFFAAALNNYLVRLGWSHGDQEIFTKDELIRYFSLEQVGKKGAIFDSKKLTWVNEIYIRATEPRDILMLIERDIEPNIMKQLGNWNKDTILAAIALYKDRVSTLRTMIGALCVLHDGPQKFECPETLVLQDTVSYLEQFKGRLLDLSVLDRASIEHCMKGLCKELGISLALLAQPLRCALTGSTASPSVYDLIVLLGREETIKRINTFMQKF